MNLPAEFEEKMKRLLGGEYGEFLKSYDSDRAMGLRVNRIKLGRGEEKRLPFTLRPVPWTEDGYYYDSAERPGRHPYHEAGVYYIQEPSAMAVAAVLEPEPGERVLDLCAAPGGKTSHAASLMAGKGFLLSNEIHPARAKILSQNVERMGLSDCVVTNESSDALARRFPGFFDKIIVDAPCSGEGMFRKEPQAVAQHSPALVARCAALGAEILENAATVLAPGGLLVYSTCTFAPEEDEGQIGHFLALHPEFELLDCGVSFGAPGEENRCGEHPFPAGLTRRIWPAQGGEGHFMAKLRKSPDAPAAVSKRTKPARPPKPCAEWLAFAAEYFPALKGQSAQAAGERLFLPPQGWQGEGLKLSIARCGVTLGRAQKGRFEPDHHLFMAFGPECENREELTLGDPRTEAWLRGEEIEAVTAKNGWCAVLVDGLPLGGGKVSGGRVKNHYPKALRNLK